MGKIDEYLISKFFINESTLSEARKILNSYNQKTLSSLKLTSSDSLMLSIKKSLQPLLKPKIYCGYDSVSDVIKYKTDEQSISLITYEDKNKT